VGVTAAHGGGRAIRQESQHPWSERLGEGSAKDRYGVGEIFGGGDPYDPRWGSNFFPSWRQKGGVVSPIPGSVSKDQPGQAWDLTLV